jgi:epsilon-lactone hydrolase
LKQVNPATRILIAGESAGGGLCLATLLPLRDRKVQAEPNLPLPIAGISISPVTDLALTGKPNRVKGSIEPERMTEMCSKYYVGDHDPRDPYISPLYGDLHGLPPLLMFVGTAEGGLDDSLRFAEKANAAGVDVRLIVGEGQVLCYPLLPDSIPESKQAVAEIQAFIRTHIQAVDAVIRRLVPG